MAVSPRALVLALLAAAALPLAAATHAGANAPPVADFAFHGAHHTTLLDVHFDERTLDPDGPADVLTRAWDTGDGFLVTCTATLCRYHANGSAPESGWEGDASSPRHRYETAGTYAVTLKVRDAAGHESVARRTLVVAEPPPLAADFVASPLAPRSGEPLLFTDASSGWVGEFPSWRWDFGDGANASCDVDSCGYGDASEPPLGHRGRAPSHAYARPGEYVVTLTLIDDAQRVASATKVVTVLNAAPVARFDVSPAEPGTGDVVLFRDASIDIDGVIASTRWDFGDGNTSSERQPTHRYSHMGLYAVELVVTDDAGASASTARPVTVKNHPPFAAVASSSATPLAGDEVRFASEASDSDGLIVNWTWSFDDGQVAYGPEVTHRFSSPGVKSVRLVVRDDAGDVHESTVEVTVLPGAFTLGVVGAVATVTTGALAFRLHEGFRWRWLLWLGPLYTRLAKSQILENGVREAIFGHIESHPGVHLRAIKRDLRLHHGTLLHHLQVLEKQGYVRSVRDGPYRRYYVAGKGAPPPGEPALVEKVLDHITLAPGATNSEVAEALGKRPSLVHYHVTRLVESGKVVRHADGREVRLYASAAAPAGEAATPQPRPDEGAARG